MKKSVLITGCSGFVGTDLARLLHHQHDYHVTGIDRDTPADEHLLDKFIRKDLNDLTATQLLQHVTHIDFVIHLAASRTDWGVDIEKFHADNVNSTNSFCRCLDH